MTDMTPNDVRALWVKRMASGDYPFMKGLIKGFNMEGQRAYCAFGVLNELAFDAGVIDRNIKQSQFGPSETVMEWAGVDDMECSMIISTNDDADTKDYGPAIAVVESLPLPEEDTK